ncbi:hypothetical protein [Oceanithermus sp.]
MKKFFTLVSVALLLLLAACSQTPAPSYRPEARVRQLAGLAQSVPDVVLFAVSGRCGVPCDGAPDDNYDYLTERGTTAAVAQAFQNLGLSVLVVPYSSHLFNHYSSISGEYEYGFLQLEADFDWVRNNWPGAHRVLLGHSHGTNWTHDLLRAHPDWTVDYLIDLDGICVLWEDDNQPYFDYFYDTYGNPWPVDLSKSCDVEPIEKYWWWTSYYSAKDVAYWGAAYNLEVQSARLLASSVGAEGDTSLVFDYTDNVRLDNSTGDIRTFVADEDHNGITYPGSSALEWINDQILELGMPQ